MLFFLFWFLVLVLTNYDADKYIQLVKDFSKLS